MRYRERVVELLPAQHLLRVGVARPGQPRQWLAVPHVVCCTGPLLDYSRLAAPPGAAAARRGRPRARCPCGSAFAPVPAGLPC
ncbi:MAG: hypothetical protein WKG07_12915 [Hymenobacter sp.]